MIPWPVTMIEPVFLGLQLPPMGQKASITGRQGSVLNKRMFLRKIAIVRLFYSVWSVEVGESLQKFSSTNLSNFHYLTLNNYDTPFTFLFFQKILASFCVLMEMPVLQSNYASFKICAHYSCCVLDAACELDVNVKKKKWFARLSPISGPVQSVFLKVKNAIFGL